MTLRLLLIRMVLYPPVTRSLFLFAISLLVLIISAALWWPTHHAVRDLTAQIKLLELRRTYLLAEAELANTLTAQRATLIDLKQKMAAHANQVDLMAQMQTLAESCGVRILEHKSLEDTSIAGATRYSIIAEGRYAGIRQFLAEITPTSPRLTAIRNVRLRKAELAPLVKAEIELISYIEVGP